MGNGASRPNRRNRQPTARKRYALRDIVLLACPGATYTRDEANVVLVSAASAWEIATKVRLGRLPGAVDVVAELPAMLIEQRFESLPMSVAHALRAGSLPGPHRDPFDRRLIAQAQAEDVPLISNETVFDAYGMRRIW